ncbi:MAG TPA: hypothetical protein VGB34_09620 [Candidatus Limnocylindria bacterium]|jgi:hypothetical protein
MPSPSASRLLTALVVAISLAGVAWTTVLAAPSDLARAKAATARFNSLTQAAAAGYGLPPSGPLHECIASFVASEGAMGFHYINGALLDTVLDPTAPEALVYAEKANGELELVALEYVVFKEPWDAENDHPPMLFDEMFMEIPAPNRYEIPAFYALHAWVWQDNPAGTFKAFNPDVSCD